MQIDKSEQLELSEIIANAVVEALKKEDIIGKADKSANVKTEKTAYQKTEQLLYNYRGFHRIVDEKRQEIADLRKYGVPQSCAVKEYVDKGGTVQGIVLPEESVESAVGNVERSVQDILSVIHMIDKAMAAIKNDPYYSILEMRYLDGVGQDDIAKSFNCSQQNVSYHKSRLIKELALRLFPKQVIDEMIQ